MKIALIGDSTTETYYLRASDNSALLGAPWNKTSDYDFSLAPALQSYLSENHTICNFARSGFTTVRALNETVNYTAGSWGSLVTTSATMWNACKSWSPDVVVMCFGINDNSYSNLAEYSTNIETIISDCKALGIRLIVWNGAYFYYGATDTVLGATHRSTIFPFFDEMCDQVVTAGYEAVDTRARWKASIDAGTWDLFGHMDATYLAGWENGSSEPEIYQNAHQWIGGQELIAAALANAIDYGTYDLDVILHDNLFDLDVILNYPAGLPLYIGSQQVQKVYFGNTEVLHMYKGNTLIF